MRRALFLLALVVAPPALGVACFEPKQYEGPIPVVSGAASRNQAILDRLAASAQPDASAPRARVRKLAKGEELGGPNATGRAGDLVLENDEVVFVVDQLGSSSGFAESGGNLVDAADARAKKDELGQLFTYFGTFPRQGVYEEIATGATNDDAAWIEAKGHELFEPKLAVTTRYTLAGGDRALLIRTILKNESDHAIAKLTLGDAIQWGGAEKFAPGLSVGFKGPSSGPYIGALGRFVSYAITSTDLQIRAVSGGSWTDTIQTDETTLKPGDSAEYSRVFLVGMRADVASVVAELSHASGQALGGLEVALVDEKGAPVKAPAGAKVVLSNAAGADVLSLRATNEGDVVGGEVPPGKYKVAYGSGGGRSARGAKVDVDVVVGKTAKVTVAVSGAGRLAVGCNVIDDTRPSTAVPVVAAPCKATIEGLGATPTPDFGPAHVAGPARHQVTTATGRIDVALAPGKYRVTLSRGPEYALAAFDVDVEEGKTASRIELLPRVVDTAGYLATDFHQHTMIGADAPVATRDRVIANAAEGVELAVASEHNVIVDLEPVVRELALERWLVEIAGDELTTDNSKKPWGHANVFPMPFDATRPRGGAPAVRDRTARDVFADLRKTLKDPFVLQINHPRYKLAGYFLEYGFDAATGVGTDPGYDDRFDALEVWNGRNVDGREAVLKDFLAMLRTGHPVTATADTDTHGIVDQEAGYPRTYVRVADDAHLDAWDAARTADLVKGVKASRDVVLTNGPFLRVSAGGAPIGGVAKGYETTVKVHVECAPWIVVDEVRLLRATAKGTDETKRVTLKPMPSGAMGADVTFKLKLTADDAIVVVASGAKPMTPVLAGDAKEIAPWAMTGAIWIDWNGDGKALGR